MPLPILIAALLLTSLLLGFARDLVIVHKLGAGQEADILFMALVLPVFFENLFGLGLRDAIIPHLQQLRAHSPAALASAARRLYAGSFFVGTGFSLLVAIAASIWLSLLAPGWSPEQIAAGTPAFALGAALIAVQTVLYCQTAFMNVEGRFVLPMWRTVLFNVGGIAGLVWVRGSITAILVGMLLGQAFLLLLLHWNVRKLWTDTGRSTTLPRHRFILGFLPVLAATALQQFCVIAERLFASLMEEGSITLLSLAFRIVTIPLTLYALSVLAILYPALALHWAQRNVPATAALLRQGLGLTLILLVPLAVLLAVVPVPIVSALLERGEFAAAQSQATAPLLTAYAIGLPAMGLALFGSRILVAQRGTRAFLATSLMAAITTITLDALLYKDLGATGLAIAFSAGAWVQALLSGWVVLRRLPAGTMSPWPLMRWFTAALLVAWLLIEVPAPEGLVDLSAYGLIVVIVHVVIVALLGERELFTRAFWTLPHRPATVATA